MGLYISIQIIAIKWFHKNFIHFKAQDISAGECANYDAKTISYHMSTMILSNCISYAPP